MTEDKNIEAKNAVGLGNYTPPTLIFDCKRYDKYLDESDLSDAEKREVLYNLWSMVVSFVYLGIGAHPLQQVTDNACEQQAEIAKFIAANADPVVTSRETTTPKFNASADRQSGQTQDRSPE